MVVKFLTAGLVEAKSSVRTVPPLCEGELRDLGKDMEMVNKHITSGTGHKESCGCHFDAVILICEIEVVFGGDEVRKRTLVVDDKTRVS